MPMTAHLTRGKVTQRVSAVTRQAPDARALLSQAAANGRQAGNAVKRPDADGYTRICLSSYPEDVTAMDAAVERLKAADPRMTRSRLVRIALRRLDLDALAAELTRHR